MKDGIPSIKKPRYKAKLVAKGYTQKKGIDFSEVYSPVVKHIFIRILLGVVAQHDMELEQLDVKTSFLHGELEDRILMNQLDGFIAKGHEDHVWLLRKSLYYLK